MSQEENDLEQAIREKLEQFRPSSPLDWERMEQRLQAEEDKQAQDATEAFDESIREKIAESRAAFNPSHWRLLSARLEAREQWLSILYRTKAIEFALMLLLFLTIFNYFPNTPKQVAVTENEAQNKIKINQSSSITQLDYPTDTFHSEEQTGSNTIAESKNTPSYNSIKFNTPAPILCSEAKQSEETIEPSAPSNLSNNISASTDVPVFEETEVREIMSEKAFIFVLPISPVVAKAKKPIQKLPNVRTPRVYAVVGNVQLYKQLNRIKIPNGSNNIFSTDPQYTVNQGVAINFGIAHKNNQVSTGISFDQLKFGSESKTVFADGSERISSKEVTLQTFAVPISFIHTFGNRRFSPFIQAGMSAHFISKAKYDYRSVAYSRASAFPLFAQPIIPLPDGLMNGGSLVSNAYLTADLGIGASYKMTKHFSLMSQIQYRHFMFNNGFGPNDNRINQLQMATGIQFRY